MWLFIRRLINNMPNVAIIDKSFVNRLKFILPFHTYTNASIIIPAIIPLLDFVSPSERKRVSIRINLYPFFLLLQTEKAKHGIILLAMALLPPIGITKLFL